MTSSNAVCFTLDMEEDIGDRRHPKYEGLKIFPEILRRLKSEGVPLTVFVAGNLLENEPSFIKDWRDVEFHAHGFEHLPHALARQEKYRRENIVKGIATFKRHFGHVPNGYRGPYGFLTYEDFSVLRDVGVKFDSSFFPGYHLSGFNFFRNNRPHVDAKSGVVEIPISGIPLVQFPYSQSYLNLLGTLPFSLPIAMNAHPKPLIFDFHLHDLFPTDLGDHWNFFWKMVYSGRNLERSWEKMKDLITALKKRSATFMTMNQLYERVRG